MDFYNRLAVQMGMEMPRGQGGASQDIRKIIPRVAKILQEQRLLSMSKEELLPKLLESNYRDWLDAIWRAESGPPPHFPARSDETVRTSDFSEPPGLEHDKKRQAEELMEQLRAMGYPLHPTNKRARHTEPELPEPELPAPEVLAPPPPEPEPAAFEPNSFFRSLSADPDDAPPRAVHRSLGASDPDDVRPAAAFRSLGASDPDDVRPAAAYRSLGASAAPPAGGADALLARLRALGFALEVADDNDDPAD
jgi:hypothetical protein